MAIDEERYRKNWDLKQYQTGRYRLSDGIMTIVFSDVELTSIRSDFKLLNEYGEHIGTVNRVLLSNDTMNELDEIAERGGER